MALDVNKVVFLSNYLTGMELHGNEEKKEIFEILSAYNLLSYLRSIYVSYTGNEEIILDSYTSLLSKVEGSSIRRDVRAVRYEISKLIRILYLNSNFPIQYRTKIPRENGTYEVYRIEDEESSTITMQIEKREWEIISDGCKLVDIDHTKRTLHFRDHIEWQCTITQAMIRTIISQVQSTWECQDYTIIYTPFTIS